VPKILRIGQFRFFFYSEEGTEPPHVHIEAAEKRAKYWLKPIEQAWNDGFRTGELKTIEKVLAENIHSLLEAWYAFFAGQ